MASLNWCEKQKGGISMIEPNDNLSREYLSSSEESLETIKRIGTTSYMWLATAKYYCEYHAVYSVLMKIGIKSEIHDCTIELAKFLEERGILEKGTYSLLKEDKKLRIDNQYYLKNKKVDFQYDELLGFVLKIKEILNSLTQEKIKRNKEGIRETKGSLNMLF